MLKIKILGLFLLSMLSYGGAGAHAAASSALKSLQIAYPATIKQVTSSYIDWKDGTRMPVHGSFSIFNHFTDWIYHADPAVGSISNQDILDDSYEPFFRKMYGGSAAEVKLRLVTIYWMPHVFGYRYPMRVTTVNGR